RRLEKVIFLLDAFRGASALRARRARPDCVHVKFVEYAVLACVMAFIDVAVVANLAEEFLPAALMPVRGGADEIIVGETHAVPQRAEFRGDFVRQLLRRLAGCLR